MINMLPYDLKECFEVYKDAVARKKAGDVKDELLNIEPAMQQCYDNYKTHFHANNLEYILPTRQMMLKPMPNAKPKQAIIFGCLLAVVRELFLRFLMVLQDIAM